MLRSLPETQKTAWPTMVNKMMHAYNCTRHCSTGFSPFYLLFGRNPRLSIDLLLGIDGGEENTDYEKYVDV